MSRVVVTAVAVVVLGCVLVGCDDARRPPPRPLIVPRTAAWARGGDGGAAAWIDCWRRSDVEQARDHQPHPDLDDRFDCDVFDDRGAIQQRGAFRLLDSATDGTLTTATQPRAPLQFRGVRDRRIDVGTGRVLVEERSLSCDAARCVEQRAR